MWAKVVQAAQPPQGQTSRDFLSTGPRRQKGQAGPSPVCFSALGPVMVPPCLLSVDVLGYLSLPLFPVTDTNILVGENKTKQNKSKT